MDSPLRGRPLAIALTALVALALCLISPRPTGFEWYALGAGLLAAVVFWFQCFDFSEEAEAALFLAMVNRCQRRGR